MSRMNPQQKAIANVFLDAVSAVDATDESKMPAGWADPLVDQLGELDAVPMTETPDGMGVDLTPLMSSAVQLIDVLVRSIAESRGADRLAVIHTIREHIDRNL